MNGRKTISNDGDETRSTLQSGERNRIKEKTKNTKTWKLTLIYSDF